MGKAVIVAVVAVVVAVVAAGVGAYILLGEKGEPKAYKPGALKAADGRTFLWAASSESGAKSAASYQFCLDHPDTPSDADLNVQATPDEKDEYWVVTVNYGGESENYWVPQEKPKPDRMKVGQSMTYAMTMSISMPTLYGGGETTSMDATFTFTVAEETTYEGVPCYKVEISGSITMMDMDIPYSGYQYVDTEDYRPRYMTLTATMTYLGEEHTVTTEYLYNYTTKKLRTKITMDGQVYSDTETNMPESTFTQYNMQEFLGEGLYAGWSKSFGFVSGSTKYTITLTVTKEELVTVPAGTFRCYVLSATVPEISEMAGVDMTFNIWVNAQMTLMPKVEMSASYQGQTTLSMTMTLQSYSGY